MGNPIYYVAHDPLGNTEQQVAEFDPALLAEAERADALIAAEAVRRNRLARVA